uniref:hypothetical protein n=1 Tax=Moorena producens TaxID=1155739 RepID=UPI0005C8BC34
SAEGDRLISAGGDGMVRFWDWPSGDPCGHIKLPAANVGIQSLAWHDQGRTLVGLDYTGRLHFWEIGAIDR